MTTKQCGQVPWQKRLYIYIYTHTHIYIYIYSTGSLVKWVECLPMVRETWVQSQIVSYQRLLKWYLIPLCLTLSIIRYVSRVKWSNPGKGVAPSPTPQCHHHHHHHHVMPPARISLTHSRHFSQSFIASGRSSGLHPISSHSCCMYVQAGHPAFARPYVGVHRSTSLMSSSLLLQQCPSCLVHLTWIVFMTGGRWLYSWCFVGCCLQDLFNIAHSILV